MSTTSATQASVINSEFIERLVRAQNIAMPTYLATADADTVGRGSSGTVSFPQVDAVAVPAGGKTENVAFSEVAQSFSDTTLSPATVGYLFALSRESEFDAIVDTMQQHVRNGSRYIMNRVDSDGLAEIANFTNTGGTTAVDFTDSVAITEIAAFIAQNPNINPVGSALILSPTAHRDWVLDLSGSGGQYLGGDAQSQQVAGLIGPGAGFKGVRHDLNVFVSTNAPTTGSDVQIGLYAMGQPGPMVYRSWRPMEVEVDYIPQEQSWDVVLSTRYGVGVATQGEARLILADNVA